MLPLVLPSAHCGAVNWCQPLWVAGASSVRGVGWRSPSLNASVAPAFQSALTGRDTYRLLLEPHSVHALVTQSWATLGNPTDCSLLGSSVHGILQARILEWVAMPSPRGSS